mmetsp:Transcript_11651/g.33561  ORF Transcript_11651/g.33561 Transcript_11651/m.33561 type:complete len:216 (+) Transcript_11651:507-1154(+)
MIRNRQFGLVSRVIKHSFHDRIVHRVRQVHEVIEHEGEIGGPAHSPHQGLQYLLLHVREFHLRVAATAEIGQQRRFHLQRLMQLDGNVQARHGDQLILLAVAQRVLPQVGTKVPIQIRHPDAHSLAAEFAEIHHLVAPFAHLDTAVFVDRFGGLLAHGGIDDEVVEALVLVAFLEQHCLDSFWDVLQFMPWQHGILQVGGCEIECARHCLCVGVG